VAVLQRSFDEESASRSTYIYATCISIHWWGWGAITYQVTLAVLPRLYSPVGISSPTEVKGRLLAQSWPSHLADVWFRFVKGSFREGWHLVFSYVSISCVSSFLIDVCMYKLNGQVSWSAVYILFSLGCFYFVSEHIWLDPITIKRSSRGQEKSHRSTSEDTGSSGKGFAISTI